MEAKEKVTAYYAKERPFKKEINALRAIVKKTELQETYKWSFPVYTVEGKNVLSVSGFKQHFGIWFFNGVFLSDPKKVLENAQEGKTKAMRHWKFRSMADMETKAILAYIEEAIQNQKKGLILVPKKKEKAALIVPPLLQEQIASDTNFSAAFTSLSPYKKREYCEYIATAKQEKTKKSRLVKITPLVLDGKGLNDKYR